MRNAVIEASGDHHPTVLHYLAKHDSDGLKVADEGGSTALHHLSHHYGPRQEEPR